MKKKYLALCGGIGGAKLAYGLSKKLSSDELIFIVNTGDDFIHFDLNISPDIDTLIYTLTNMNDHTRGWGIKDETWEFMRILDRIKEDTWFQLGDKDLMTHIKRSFLIKEGGLFSEVITKIAVDFNVNYSIFPMSEIPVSTILETDIGILSFQEYFVKHKCHPAIKEINFRNSINAKVPDSLLQKMQENYFSGIIICPSNPYLSIDPILSVKDIRDFLINRKCPAIAVSPIIKNRAIKGPTVKIMEELDLQVSIDTILDHYKDMIDILLVDHEDKLSFSGRENIQIEFDEILMTDTKTKITLAEACLNLLN